MRAMVLAALVWALISPAAFPSFASAEPARSAWSFTDSVGVNVHMSYTDTVYFQRAGTLRDRLVELGVRHARDGICAACGYQHDKQKLLGQAGIGFTFIVGPGIGWLSDAETVEQKVAAVDAKLLPYTDAVEAINEPDNFGDGQWAAKTVDQQRRLWQAVKSNPRLAHLPVLGPSVTWPWNLPQIGDLTPWMDYGNFHPYPGGDTPEAGLDYNLPRFAPGYPGRPMMATETGYHNAVAAPGSEGHRPTSEAATAVYLPRLFLENFRRGIARSFSYELVDLFPDPANGNRERHFGLLRNDLSRKPAFDSLRNLLTLLADTPGGAVPAALDVRVDAAGVNRVLLAKRDGSFWLAVWNTGRVWDPDRRLEMTRPERPVTVTLPEVMHAAVYRPLHNTDPTWTTTSERLELDVPADVLLIELRAAADPDTSGPIGDDQESSGRDQQSGGSGTEEPGDTGGSQQTNGGGQSQDPGSEEEQQDTGSGGDEDAGGEDDRARNARPKVRLKAARRAGKVRLRALTSDPDGRVREVRFYVRGRRVARDRRAPFRVTVPRRVRGRAWAVAYDDDRARKRSGSVRLRAVR